MLLRDAPLSGQVPKTRTHGGGGFDKTYLIDVFSGRAKNINLIDVFEPHTEDLLDWI